MDIPIKVMILLYCDNMSNIHLAQKPVFHAHTKHIEVHYHFIRERIQARDVDLQHINMELQVVHIFTKTLGVDKVRQFMADLGLTIVALSSLRGSTTTNEYNMLGTRPSVQKYKQHP